MNNESASQSLIRHPQSVAIMLLHSPYTHSINETALRYVKSLLAQGHSVYRLFLYHESVHIASTLSITAQDEINFADAWQTLIHEHNIDCVACISSSLKRGIINEQEAKRYDKPHYNIADNIALGGLGDWIEATNTADTHICFS